MPNAEMPHRIKSAAAVNSPPGLSASRTRVKAPIEPEDADSDPESLSEVMSGNILVKLAAALIVLLAIIGALMAFGG